MVTTRLVLTRKIIPGGDLERIMEQGYINAIMELNEALIVSGRRPTNDQIEDIDWDREHQPTLLFSLLFQANSIGTIDESNNEAQYYNDNGDKAVMVYDSWDTQVPPMVSGSSSFECSIYETEELQQSVPCMSIDRITRRLLNDFACRHVLGDIKNMLLSGSHNLSQICEHARNRYASQWDSYLKQIEPQFRSLNDKCTELRATARDWEDLDDDEKQTAMVVLEECIDQLLEWGACEDSLQEEEETSDIDILLGRFLSVRELFSVTD